MNERPGKTTCLILLMFLLVASGCGTEQAATNLTPASSPAGTALPAAILTPTPPPTAVPTSTPVPTPTPPQATRTKASTPTPTATPEQTPLPTHTVPPPGVVLDLEIADVTEDSIMLRWKPPANSDDVPVGGYEVITDIALRPDEHHFVSEPTFMDMGLRGGTEHKYRVRAIGPDGVEGAEVNIAVSTLDPATPEPTRTPTPEPTPTETPQPTSTPSSAPTPPATATEVPTPTPTPEPTSTETPQPTSTPSPAPTPPATATEVPTPTPTPEPTPTHTPQPASTPTPLTTLMWRGLVVATENRCSPYTADYYPYSQGVEERIIVEMGGIIYGPYTGTYFSSTRETDIEHIVARSEAHDSGLCAADAATRRRFAGDLLNLTLASPAVNRQQKSGYDGAEWLPDLNQCWFVNRVVRVRLKYGLTIDQREADALDSVLSGCSSVEMLVVPAPVQESPTPTPTPGASVDALAMWDDNNNGRITCTEAKRHGIAPVRRGHPAYQYMDDRDNDGVVCE